MAQTSISDLPARNCAAVVYNDENGNMKVDYQLSCPAKALDSLNDVRPRITAPRFEDGKFLLEGAHRMDRK
ncbi:MAG: DUF2141 domain-containing protein [Alphaproteobacteria bacterium]|nr:DUF2141 domain-containing protein [Alphaproteobacteria bacterium]